MVILVIHNHECLPTPLMSTAQVRSRGELYEHILAWIADQKFADRSRNFVASMAFAPLFDEANPDDESGDEPSEDNEQSWGKARRAPLQFTLAPGTHFFRYKGKMAMLERTLESSEESFYPQEAMEFSIMGREPVLLKELLREAREKFLLKDKSKTVIYRRGARNTALRFRGPSVSHSPADFSLLSSWTRSRRIGLSTTSGIPGADDAKWYSGRGIPYRRG